MALGITISSGKTGMSGTNAGWRRVRPLFEWECPSCGRLNAKHWMKCPDCCVNRPDKG